MESWLGKCVLCCIGNISSTRIFQTFIQIAHPSLSDPSKDKQNTARAMKKTQDFWTIPSSPPVATARPGRQLASFHKKIPRTRELRYWIDSVNRNLWPACQATCSKGDQAMEGAEFNFLNNSLYMASQHLSNLCHLKELSLCLTDRGNKAAECAFSLPHTRMTLETPK